MKLKDLMKGKSLADLINEDKPKKKKPKYRIYLLSIERAPAGDACTLKEGIRKCIKLARKNKGKICRVGFLLKDKRFRYAQSFLFECCCPVLSAEAVHVHERLKREL